MTKRTVIFDIDGVLADFTLAFTTLAAQYYRFDVFSCGAQHNWEYKGLSRSETSALWGRIRASQTFWRDVPTLLTPGDLAMVQRLAAVPDMRFAYVTNRTGDDTASTYRQCKKALARYGMPEGLVIVTRDKVDAVKALGPICAILEDSGKNIEAYAAAGYPVYRRAWPYNRDVVCTNVVHSVAEFCGRVLERKAGYGSSDRA